MFITTGLLRQINYDYECVKATFPLNNRDVHSTSAGLSPANMKRKENPLKKWLRIEFCPKVFHSLHHRPITY